LQKLTVKASVRSFLGVKNDPKYIFEKIHNQPVFKTCLGAIQNGKLVKCKRLCSDFGVATEKKETTTGPMRKHTYQEDITCSHIMLMLLIWEQSWSIICTVLRYMISDF